MKQLDIVLQIETWIPVKLTIVVNASFVHLHLIWGVCVCVCVRAVMVRMFVMVQG